MCDRGELHGHDEAEIKRGPVRLDARARRIVVWIRRSDRI
jgi:hypothetical protein